MRDIKVFTFDCANEAFKCVYTAMAVICGKPKPMKYGPVTQSIIDGMKELVRQNDRQGSNWFNKLTFQVQERRADDSGESLQIWRDNWFFMQKIGFDKMMAEENPEGNAEEYSNMLKKSNDHDVFFEGGELVARRYVLALGTLDANSESA